MLNRKIIIYLLVSLTLLVLSGGFLTSFQLWVGQQTQKNLHSQQDIPSFSAASGIRNIVSSPQNLPAVFKEQNVHEKSVNVAIQEQFVPGRRVISNPVLEIKESSFKKDYANLHPTLIHYPSELVLEFPQQIASTMNVRRAVARLLLSQNPFQEYNLLSRQRINLQQSPHLLHHVLDQNGQPIRFPKQAYAYADYLLSQRSQQVEDDEGKFLLVQIPIVEAGLSYPAKKYRYWVEKYAAEFNISPALIYAVIEVESSFRPHAVSRSNALGLMQIKASAAGKDVFKLVDGRSGKPSVNELFNPQKNIRMGTAYLWLLKNEYLSGIKNEKSRKLVAISSYNGGMTAMFRLFGKSPDLAIANINRLSPDQVYRALRFDHPFDETRRYLDKVLNAEKRFQTLLNIRELHV